MTVILRGTPPARSNGRVPTAKPKKSPGLKAGANVPITLQLASRNSDPLPDASPSSRQIGSRPPPAWSCCPLLADRAASKRHAKR
jgi:hypothetical protein